MLQEREWFAPMKSSHPFAGFLIAIEGIDGAGKTTLAHHVQEKLQARHFAVLRTREPTSGHWGQMLRDSALTGRLSLEEELEAFINDRREHVDKVIIPELEAGKVVIVDRYYFSTMAYQGARGIDPDEIRRRNEVFAPEPDLLVILDLEPKTGLERIRTRGDRATHFEKTRTLARAREIFRAIQKPYLYRVDASQPVETICDSVLARFSKIAEERKARCGEPSAARTNETLNLFGAPPKK
jgi:dTMP kinase